MTTVEAWTSSPFAIENEEGEVHEDLPFLLFSVRWGHAGVSSTDRPANRERHSELSIDQLE